MPKLNIKVTRENSTGRNTGFTVNGSSMSRAQAVKVIKSTNNSGYHVRRVNGLATPASNPDGNKRNNLG